MNTIRIINTKGGIMAKQFETVLWCIKAVTADDTRTALKHLYIDNDFMAGCDGHRLHIALNDWDFEPGLYEILNIKANEILLAKSETLSLADSPPSGAWSLFSAETASRHSAAIWTEKTNSPTNRTSCTMSM